MFFGTMCCSFKGFKRAIQKFEYPKNYLEICQTPKNSKNFPKL